MALEQKLTLKLQQKLVMTPALQLAIKLLQLNKLELEQMLQQEMVDNPVLEEREEQAAAEEEEGTEPEETTDNEIDSLIDNLDDEAFFAKMFDYQPGSTERREQDDAPPLESTLTREQTLADYLVWQLEVSDLSVEQTAICHAVIGNIDPAGFLRAMPAEIAEMGDWPLDRVEAAIQRVQAFDPAGVAALDVRECLLLQLVRLGLGDSLAGFIVRDHLDDFAARRYREITRACHVDLGAVADVADIIRELTPRPGQMFAPGTPHYIIPDVLVFKDDGKYVVQLNEDGLPKLKVSRFYRRMLQSRTGLSNEAARYLQDKLRSALWLIRSFGQRQRTIRKVANSIVMHQQEFLDNGLQALRPMVLRDVAEDIAMHESTVSRVVNGKYMHTAQGIYEMKFFFHSALGHINGSEISSVTVKDKIRRLTDSEDQLRPLSDAAIAECLKASGLRIVRRTVAKYREEMGIPASRSRRAIR